MKKDMLKLENNRINILNVDSLKFENYYTCEFKSLNKKKGYILLKKSKLKFTSIDKLISEKIYFNELCDVIEFQPNKSDITFRGHATISGIYEDGELIIDLENDIEKPYYQLCYKTLKQMEQSEIK